MQTYHRLLVHLTDEGPTLCRNCAIHRGGLTPTQVMFSQTLRANGLGGVLLINGVYGDDSLDDDDMY